MGVIRKKSLLPPRHKEENIYRTHHCNNMKTIFVALLGSALIVGLSALPQYNQQQSRPSIQTGNHNRRPDHGGSGNHGLNVPPGCRIEYKTIHDTVLKEEFERVCKPVYERKCETKYRSKCTPYYEDLCQTKYETKCTTKYEKKCETHWRDEQEEYQHNVCTDHWEKKCEQHWQTNAHNDKVWVDDPSTCKDYKKTECNPQTSYRNKRVPYEECKDVPWQDCRELPRKSCRQVEKQNCKEVPYDDCKQVERQQCKDIHKNVPHAVASKEPVVVCDNDDYGSSSGSGSRPSIIDLRGGSADEEEEPKRKSDSFIFSD